MDHPGMRLKVPVHVGIAQTLDIAWHVTRTGEGSWVICTDLALPILPQLCTSLLDGREVMGNCYAGDDIHIRCVLDGTSTET
jgi:hypothetical protein